MSRLRALSLLFSLVVVPPAAAQGGITDGTSNTVIIGEHPFGDTGCQFGSFADGTSNTLVFGAGVATECRLPIGGSTACAIRLAGVTDGSSNTLLVSETPGAGCFVPLDPVRCLVQTLPVAGTGDLPDVRIGTDGAPCLPTSSAIMDGTSNTLFVGECSAVPPGTTVVPEPPTLALLAGGLGVLALRARAGRRRSAR